MGQFTEFLPLRIHFVSFDGKKEASAER